MIEKQCEVIMQTVTEVEKEGVKFTGVRSIGKRFEAFVEGEYLGFGYHHRTAEILVEKKLGIFVDRRSKNAMASGTPSHSKTQKFHINERFDFLEKAILMVADGVQPSVVITGDGGLGKTFTVRKMLRECGFNDISGDEFVTDVNPYNTFVFVKGFTTAKNLYRILHTYNGCIIVLDDIDNIFKDQNAINVLKAALDSYDKRLITWGAEQKGKNPLPRTFEFTGRIVFITNLSLDNIDQALKTRALTIDVSMTPTEMIDRMRVIADGSTFLPHYTADIKKDAIEFLDEHKEVAPELSLRSLIAVCNIRHEYPNDWESMSQYVICGQC